MLRPSSLGVVLVAAVLGCLLPPTAGAGYPGKNGFIAFSADEYSVGELYVGSAVWAIRGNGSGYRRITNECDGECGFRMPAWDSSGRTMLVSRVDCSRREEEDPSQCVDYSRSGIWEFSARGSSARSVFESESSTAPGAPYPSPDGSQFVYDDPNSSFDREVWIANRDGTDRVLLAKGSQPRFSPDGKTIAYIGHADRRGIWLMDRDGTHQRRIINGYIHSFDWAPGGRRLIYAPDYVFPSHLFSVSVRGKDRKQLTHARRSADESPTVSPDGTRVAFVRYRGGDERITPELRYTRLARGRSRLIRRFDPYYFEDEHSPELHPAWRPRP